MMKPAQARARAPVARLALELSWGRVLLLLFLMLSMLLLRVLSACDDGVEAEKGPAPAPAPAPAPVIEVEVFVLADIVEVLVEEVIEVEAATLVRSAFNVEKYSAEPNPVRSTLGNVPLQSERSPPPPPPPPAPPCWPWAPPEEEDEERMWRSVGSKGVREESCWRRVLSRSAGWRSDAERMPVVRPARKWVAGGREGERRGGAGC